MITNIRIIFPSIPEQALRWAKRWTCLRVRHVKMFLEQPWLRFVVFCVFPGVTWPSTPPSPAAWCLNNLSYNNNLKVIQNISSEHFLNMPPTPLYGPSLLPLDIQPKYSGFLSQMDLFALVFDGPAPDPSEHTPPCQIASTVQLSTTPTPPHPHFFKYTIKTNDINRHQLSQLT